MKNLRLRLSILNFLEFAVWGSYLTSLGNFLWSVGLAREIFWFYAVQGILSLFMPAMAGYIADRVFEQRKVLAGCHLLSSFFKWGALIYCVLVPQISFWPLFLLFGMGIGFYIPTIGLNNAFVLRNLQEAGYNTAKVFPGVRIFGTIGFITAMLMVNFIHFQDVQLQASVWQLGLSAIFGMTTVIYMLTFKRDQRSKQVVHNENKHGYITLLKDRKILYFLIFVFLISVCLQITNSYGNVFITSFSTVEEFAHTWGARNANALISISQISETLCVLIIPVAMKYFDIKRILIIAAMAWMLRFGFLAIGDTGNRIIFIIFSMLVYGIAFDFVNIAGAIYLDSQVDVSLKNRIQGLFMLVMSGLGATIGTPLAGIVVNDLVYSKAGVEMSMNGWSEAWGIFAAYALLVALLLFLFYPSQEKVRTV